MFQDQSWTVPSPSPCLRPVEGTRPRQLKVIGRAAIFLTFPLILVVVEDPWIYSAREPNTSIQAAVSGGPVSGRPPGREPAQAINGRAAIFLTFPLILVVAEDLISGPWVCGLAPVFQMTFSVMRRGSAAAGGSPRARGFPGGLRSP